MCRSRRELSNEYLLAKIGVDTAENEPLEVWGKIFNIIHWCPKAAHLPWTIYHRAARPRGLELVAILEPKMKCERPAGDAPAVVEDLAACVADAEAQGRKFVNFEPGRKLCYTSITCDRPAKSRSYEWQVYKLDEATSSTQ